MFLKQLEIIGFKSFAEKIILEFVPGVTAVVGPNGSGKSNITDAIRWVLGEQSAKSLRGGKMDDIIFAGSDSRKPLNYAEVILTLNNEDATLPIEYSEVSVVRRVYRSGESDFLINGQHCRLKDIIDLFLDSGLGKEAFSIIGQGKVDEILNSKPEDRRSIFEEAAGVLKYKTRKKKAEGKLKETSENLNRVNDILHELKSQIEPLSIQASIAKEYLHKKEELEYQEIALTAFEIETLHEKWKSSKIQLDQFVDREISLKAEVLQIENHLEEDREKLKQLDEIIASRQADLLRVTKEREKLEGQRLLMHEKRKNAAENTEQLKRNLQDVEQKLDEITKKQQVLEQETEDKEKEVKQLEKRLANKKAEEKKLLGNIDETIESLKSDYIELLNLQAANKNEHGFLEQQMAQLEQKKNRLTIENKKFLEERIEVDRALLKKNTALDSAEHKISLQATLYERTKEELTECKLQYDEMYDRLIKANQIIQKVQARKETLKEMEAGYTGFFQGVKSILQAKDKRLSGIEGAVIELIQVSKEFSAAIDTALGGGMQNIIVATDHEARQAIHYLKEKRSGRATFLPLNIIKEKNMPSHILSTLRDQPAFIGIASELIHYQAKYTPAISNLLGNVIVARDLQGGNHLAKLVQYRYRIVTLEGDVINPGGSMTGGAATNSSTSPLGRKTELEELKLKLTDMKEQTKRLEENVNNFKESIAKKEQELENIRHEGEGLRENVNEIKSHIGRLILKQDNLNDRLAIYDLDTTELDNEKEHAQSRVKELVANIKDSDDKINALNKEITTLTDQRNNERQIKEELTNKITDTISKLAVAKEQLLNYQSLLKTVRDEQSELEGTKETLTEHLMLLSSELSGQNLSEDDIDKAAQAHKQEQIELEHAISLKREERFTLQQEIEETEQNLRDFKRILNDVSQSLKTEEVKINRLDVELDNLLNRLREEFTLSYEAAKSQYPLKLSVDATKQKIKLLKIEISELGSVNIGAIDEYDRVNERHHFLLEQQADLLEAQAHLFEVMEEMDTEMTTRFIRTFQDIQNEFEGVFKSLFGGGRAELKLTNPDDLLYTGIDIVAQPPGKKLQNLSLLSGGERSLTAIALLFSILKVRPVPFCILDEVEAALDEANVHRFSHYLKEFSKETQFIVITHRQGTMEGADVLYGVTMQESGVSKIVSVRLENEEPVVQI